MYAKHQLVGLDSSLSSAYEQIILQEMLFTSLLMFSVLTSCCQTLRVTSGSTVIGSWPCAVWLWCVIYFDFTPLVQRSPRNIAISQLSSLNKWISTCIWSRNRIRKRNCSSPMPYVSRGLVLPLLSINIISFKLNFLSKLNFMVWSPALSQIYMRPDSLKCSTINSYRALLRVTGELSTSVH